MQINKPLLWVCLALCALMGIFLALRLELAGPPDKPASTGASAAPLPGAALAAPGAGTTPLPLAEAMPLGLKPTEFPKNKAGVAEAKGSAVKLPELYSALPSESTGTSGMAQVKAFDGSHHRILLIGDSMMEQLMFRMKDYTEANGHQLLPVVWYGSSTKVWGESDTLAHFVAQWQPTYVIVCLGGNELFIRGIANRRPFVDRLLEQVMGLPTVWLGPPNWKKDTGINDLILEAMGQSRYYPSKNLKLARRRDGAHPTKIASGIWMDSVAQWLGSSACAYPLDMDTPTTKARHTPKAVLLQMLVN